jgi:hypothetical protein
VFVEEMVRFSGWLAATPASRAVQGIDGYVPAIQSVHIVAIAVVIASGAMVNLRLLGAMNRSLSVESLGARFSRPVWLGVCVLALSGLALLLAEPERSLASQVFQLKVGLLAIALVVTLRLLRRVSRHGAQWDAAGAVPLSARIPALAALLLWAAIVFAGRWIAYAQY